MKNLPIFFARKYFFSGKISGVVHIIAAISLVGITFGSFALIAILSSFNGFEDIVNKMYNTFDSDIKIYPSKGKYFSITKSQYDQIKNIANVRAFTPVIEENALLKYKEKQTIATIKAVLPNYLKSMGLDTLVKRGENLIFSDSIDYALAGAGVANKLNLQGADEQSPLQVFLPKKGTIDILRPENAFNKKNIFPSGIFSTLEEFDNKYVLVPLKFGRIITDQISLYTAYELNVKDEKELNKIKSQIKEILHSTEFKVLDKYQQQSTLYKVMKSEKFAVYLVLSFVIAIAAFNLIGCLLMLSLEKRKDMMTMISLGAENSLIKNIILYEGLLITIVGCFIGMGLGFIVCLLQQKYGFLKIAENSTFVYSSYPITFKYMDFVLVFATVLFIGWIASWIPSRFAYKNLNIKDLKN